MTISGSADMLRNADVGHMLELRERLSEAERELAAAKAELDRLKAALVKLKPYTECACPEDPETGRVSYHFNCARSGRKIIDEALKP